MTMTRGVDEEGIDVAGQRGGRRRAAPVSTDEFRDSLVAALAQALDVAAAALEVQVTLDGEPVGEGRTVDEVVLTEVAVVAEAVTPKVEAVRSDVQPRGAGPRTPGSGRDRDEEGETARRNSRPSEPVAEATPVTAEELDEEAEAAADLLEGLLDAMDLPGDLRISLQDAHAEVEIVGLSEGVLIGRRGQTLDAVQELVRTAMQRRFERRSRVLVDVDGYRARRLEKLLERADEVVAEVLESGESQRLEPMDSIERRLVHQRVASHEGVVSHSHGREPSRRIVIDLAD